MMVSPGARFGPYTIVAPLGKGAMGEVYRAADTRLHRTVAIKLLPHDKVADPERKRRFLQEARAASAVNHPNIVTLHDIASEGGVDYLVMEYVPGNPLNEIIRPQGLPMPEAVGYAAQISDALAAAHAAGIVHRDIKPANVIVTAESQVKVLDLGLAKLGERDLGPEDETVTRESTLTETGALIGTFGYMSPEQAGARTVDHRTDIFSLGVLLYEMLTGARPFRGASPVETLHAIINGPAPPLAGHPPELQEIMAKMLAKDPKDRYQHAGDCALDLRRFQKAWEAKALISQRVLPEAAETRRFPWAATAALLVVLLPAAWWIGRSSAVGDIDNPLANAKYSRLTDFDGAEFDPAISRDGKFVAFLSDRDGVVDVYVSQIGSGLFSNLTHGKEAVNLFLVRELGFIPDGSQIWLAGAINVARMRLIPLMGGAPRPFLNERVVNTNWSPDGSRVVYHTFDAGDPIFVADANGANAKQIFVARMPGAHAHFPTFSADGRWIYFAMGIPDTRRMDLWRIPSSGGDAERLTTNKTVSYPTPIDPRTVLYISTAEDGSGPWVWALDPERKRTRRVSFGLEKYTSMEATPDGRRLVASIANPSAGLWSIPILPGVADEADVRPYPVTSVRALGPRFGGGSLFYLSSRGSGDGLWRYRDGQALEIWKGSDGAILEPAAVSPDGSRASFVLLRDGRGRLNVISANGAEVQSLADSIDAEGAASWSPDGKWIAVAGSDAHGPGLFRVAVDGSSVQRFLAAPASDPLWSPDGSMIIYRGARIGLWQSLLAVRPDGQPVELPPIQLRTQGQRYRFLPDGSGVVYMQGAFDAQDFWLLDMRSRKTRQLARLKYPAEMRNFDVTPDGKQIIFDRLRQNSDIVLIDLPKKGP